MDLNAFIAMMERIAPPELALPFDNVGLIVGTGAKEIRSVLVALDCTVAVVEEARDLGANLVLAHHPLLFSPVKRVMPDTPETAALYALIANGIGMYAAHTNLDAAPGGVNDCLAKLLGVARSKPILPENIGRIGTLPVKKRATLQSYAAFVGQELGAAARIVGDPCALVERVAFIGGSGGGDLKEVKAAGADTFVTGELKHDQALSALVLGLNVIVAGHYETERPVLLPLIGRLQRESDDVQYNLTHSESACIKGI